MLSFLLAGFVFGATIITTVIVALANEQSPNGKALAMSPMPIFVGGMTIAGMLVLSHWVKWTW